MTSRLLVLGCLLSFSSLLPACDQSTAPSDAFVAVDAYATHDSAAADAPSADDAFGASDAPSSADAFSATDAPSSADAFVADDAPADPDAGFEGDAGSVGAGECDPTACTPECFRAITCVKECGGPATSCGCCACAVGSFDAVACS
ncbi:MAG: hypothetical protein K1X94_07185 [Sandaracinaceae bacterium]|nr:hypothetical protein [Sandaracinaceae bacterium]